MPRRYTKRTQTNAVGIAVVEGVTEAERQTGIPKETIHYWTKKPEFAQLRTTARETVADQFWVGIQIGIEQVAAGLAGDAPLKEKAAALSILYDRHALMTGMATSRTESRDLTGTIADADLAAAIREAVEITAGSGSPSTPEDPPEG